MVVDEFIVLVRCRFDMFCVGLVGVGVWLNIRLLRLLLVFMLIDLDSVGCVVSFLFSLVRV